jgi:hypothetical protein
LRKADRILGIAYMNEEQSANRPPQDADDQKMKKGASVALATPSSNSESDSSTTNQAKKQKELTPDEQMALYEKDLKENDWGHQPC